MYVLILCWRYLRARRGVILSILALATGVTALIVVLAVMNGFSGLLHDRVRGSLSDVVVEREDFWGVQGAEGLRRELAGLPHVVGCSAHLTGIAFLSLADEQLPLRIPVEFVALDPAEEARVGAFPRWLVADGPGGWEGAQPPPGTLPASPLPTARMPLASYNTLVEPFALPDGERPERPVILGAEVLENLPGLVRPGTRILLATPISWEDHNVAVFTVTGFYKSGMYKTDAHTVFLPLAVAQQWRRAPDTASSFHLSLDDVRHASEVVEAARKVAAQHGEFFVDTWQKMRRQLLVALVAERTIWVVVLTVLLGLAGFSVVAVLNLIVFQRRRDIGVVRSVGGSRRGVAGTFVLYGLAVGVVGAALGTAAGRLILTHIDWLEEHLPGGLFPRSVFYLEEHIPWEISPVTVAAFALLGVLVSVLGSLYPAWRASRLQPHQVLHRMV